MSAPPIAEADWQRTVIDLARLGGWRVFHALPASRGGRIATHQLGDRGFPDLILARSGRTPIAAELKTQTGRLTVEQREWLDALLGNGAASGMDVRVWRPSDLDEVRRTLIGTRERRRK